MKIDPQTVVLEIEMDDFGDVTFFVNSQEVNQEEFCTINTFCKAFFKSFPIKRLEDELTDNARLRAERDLAWARVKEVTAQLEHCKREIEDLRPLLKIAGERITDLEGDR